MELDSFNVLERQINSMLEKFKAVRVERDELAERVQQLEADNYNLRRSSEDLQLKLVDVESNTRDRARDAQIKAKVEELLAKLEGF